MRKNRDGRRGVDGEVEETRRWNSFVTDRGSYTFVSTLVRFRSHHPSYYLTPLHSTPMHSTPLVCTAQHDITGRHAIIPHYINSHTIPCNTSHLITTEHNTHVRTHCTSRRFGADAFTSATSLSIMSSSNSLKYRIRVRIFPRGCRRVCRNIEEKRRRRKRKRKGRR